MTATVRRSVIRPSRVSPQAIETNGIGQITTSHLNLTKCIELVPRNRNGSTWPKKLFRLRDWQGNYLHMTGAGLTRNKQYAWVGTEAQLEQLRAQRPETKELIASEAL